MTSFPTYLGSTESLIFIWAWSYVFSSETVVTQINQLSLYSRFPVLCLLTMNPPVHKRWPSLLRRSLLRISMLRRSLLWHALLRRPMLRGSLLRHLLLRRSEQLTIIAPTIIVQNINAPTILTLTCIAPTIRSADNHCSDNHDCSDNHYCDANSLI